MSDQSLELALKIRADLADATVQVGQLSKGLDANAVSALSAADALQKVSAATSNVDALAAADQRVAQAAAAAAREQERLSTYQPTPSRLASQNPGLVAATPIQPFKADTDAASKYIEKLKQQAAALGLNREELAALQAKAAGFDLATQKQAAAIGAKVDAWARDEAAARAAARAEDAVAAAQARFMASLKVQQATAGATTAGEKTLAKAQALGFSASELASIKQTLAEIEKGGASASKGMLGLGDATVGAKREMMVMAHEAVSGNFSKMPGSLMVLAERGNLASMAIGLMTNPLVLAGTAAAVAAAGFIQAANSANAMTRAVELTGNRAGVTNNQIVTMAKNVAAQSHQSIATVQDLATSLVATGEYSGQVVGRMTSIIAEYAKKTGQDVSKVAPQIEKAFADPKKGAEALDKQLNFLTADQIAYVASLVKKGDTETAQLVIADALTAKLKTMGEHVTAAAGLWEGLGTAASNAWHKMFAPATDDEKIKALNEKITLWKMWQAGGTSGAGDKVKEYQAELDALTAKTKAQEAAAKAQGEATKKEQARKLVLGDIAAAEEKAKTKAEKRADAIKKLDDALKAGDISQTEYKRGVAAFDKEFADKSAIAAANKVDNAYAQQQLSLTKEIEASKRKLAAAQSGITVEEGRARDNLDDWLRLNRTALKLSEDKVAALRKLADEADRISKAAKDSEYVLSLSKRADAVGQTPREALKSDIERNNLAPAAKAQAQTEADRLAAAQEAETLKQLQQQYLSESGQTVAAQSAAMELQYGKLMKDLTSAGDTAGLEIVNKLINVKTAKAKLDELQKQIDDALARQTTGETELQTAVATGATTQAAARQQLLALHRDTATQIEAMLPEMKALATETGNAQAIQRVAELDQKMKALKNTSSDLQNAFGNAFTGSMSSALNDLATGTKSLGEAVRGFLNSMATSLAQFASQQLAQSAYSSIKGIFSAASTAADATKTAKTATTAVDTVSTVSDAASAAETATAISGAFTAGAVEASTGITSGAAVAATEMGGAITAAGTTAASAMASAIISASATGSGTGAATSVASVAVAAAATGGYISGPGTGTSDSVPAMLSNGEFVARAAVVAQPGAREFLHAFNRYGMRVLHFAEGGLVGLQASARPAYTLTSGSEISGAGGVTVNQRLLPVLDDDLIADALKGPRGEKITLLHITRNPAKYRQALGIKG